MPFYVGYRDRRGDQHAFHAWQSRKPDNEPLLPGLPDTTQRLRNLNTR